MAAKEAKNAKKLEGELRAGIAEITLNFFVISALFVPFRRYSAFSLPTGLEVGITDVEDDGIWAFHQNTFTGHRRNASLR